MVQESHRGQGNRVTTPIRDMFTSPLTSRPMMTASLRPVSFYLPQSRVDAVYFTLGTFTTTTGTGRFAAH
jgi:hypothetical protein